jgi:hypothetical protein
VDAVNTLFNNLYIHSMEPDDFGRKWTDHLAVIPTDRKAARERLSSPARRGAIPLLVSSETGWVGTSGTAY